MKNEKEQFSYFISRQCHDFIIADFNYVQPQGENKNREMRWFMFDMI